MERSEAVQVKGNENLNETLILVTFWIDRNRDAKLFIVIRKSKDIIVEFTK